MTRSLRIRYLNVLQPTRVRCCLAACYLLLAPRLYAIDFVYPAARHSLDALTPTVSPYPNLTDHAEPGRTRKPMGINRWQISFTHVNQFSGGVATREQLLLDGERTVTALSGLFGVHACWDLSLNVPLVAHADGYFDRSIESWHQFFNLPNGNRADAEPNNLEIVYRDEGSLPVTLASAGTSVGDISVQAFYHCLQPGLLSGWVPSVGLKLPTGDESLLSGSGATDVLAGITSAPFYWSDRIQGRASVGLAFAGDSPLFEREARQILNGSLVLGFRWSQHHEWLAQLDVNSASFDSALLELGSTTAQLTVAWRHHYARKRWFEVGIVEDLIADTAPDIALYLSWVNLTGQ